MTTNYKKNRNNVISDIGPAFFVYFSENSANIKHDLRYESRDK